MSDTLATRTIGGREYQCDAYDFDDGWLMFVRLATLVAPGLGRPKSIAEAVSMAGIELERIPAAILAEGAGLLDALFARTYWLDGGKRVRLNTPAGRTSAFGRDYVAAAEVAYFVLEHNYSDSIKAAQAKLASP
jgi:hypothetical protein